MKRRNFLIGAAAVGAGAIAYNVSGLGRSISVKEMSKRVPLSMPPLIDTRATGTFTLTAQSGKTSFLPGRYAHTLGFNQSYLGPVVRVSNGQLRPIVQNTLSWPISAHWHGLVVPGENDGGPHQHISPGSFWMPNMEIKQEPCTAFFHTHIHGRTARDVYAGLAGVMHVTDGRDDERGLPQSFGIDDLTLVLQDRRFSNDGELAYANSMMDVMHGMTGDRILINGQLEPLAVVPKSVVRLRLVNASNARIYSLFFDDGRPINLIATDGGYLPKTATIDRLRLSPGERVEVLVDFSSGKDITLLSDGDPNQGMGGMMGRARGYLDRITGLRTFPVLPFTVDDQLERPVTKIPEQLGGSAPNLLESEVSNTRRFALNMGMGGGMMGSGMMSGNSFAINNMPFNMNTINETVKLGSTEKWVINNGMLAHPFHIHGVQFQVLKENGRMPLPESLGWKDTIVVDGETELLMRFTETASEESPFMYHCHILEHEDAGMMGQFTVG